MVPAVNSSSHDAFERFLMKLNLACQFDMAICFNLAELSFLKGQALTGLLVAKPPDFAGNHILDQRREVFIQPLFQHGPHKLTGQVFQ